MKFFDEVKKIRVGEVGSPVLPGDMSPTGKRYERGQFAPSLDELASTKLAEVDNFNLLDSSDVHLPFKDGFTEDAIKNWNPQPLFDLLGNGIILDKKLPPYVVVSIYFALKLLPNQLLKDINLKHIDYSEDGFTAEATKFDSVTPGDTIVVSKTVTSNKMIFSKLIVLPRFYEYVSSPLVKQIPERTYGMSVANYVVLHSVGHCLYKKYQYTNEISKLYPVLELNKWNKNTISGQAGQYFLLKNNSSWRRDASTEYLNEASRYSPEDSFSEIFAHYFTHNIYLELFNKQMYDAAITLLSPYLPKSS